MSKFGICVHGVVVDVVPSQSSNEKIVTTSAHEKTAALLPPRSTDNHTTQTMQDMDTWGDGCSIRGISCCGVSCCGSPSVRGRLAADIAGFLKRQPGAKQGSTTSLQRSSSHWKRLLVLLPEGLGTQTAVWQRNVVSWQVPNSDVASKLTNATSRADRLR